MALYNSEEEYRKAVEELQKQIKGFGEDEGSLKDDELRNLLEAYRNLGDTKGRKSIGAFQVIGGGSTIKYQDLPGIDTTADVKRLQGLVDARGLKAQNEAQANDFLTALPGELEQSREEFLAGESKRAVESYTLDYVPRAMESANARGALFSGDTGDLLTTGAFDVAGAMDEIRAKLEAEDNEFYFNAAYQSKVRQVLETNANMKSYLDNERTNVLQDQSNRFQSAQGDLNRKLDTSLTDRTYSANLRAREAENKRNSDKASKSKTSALYGELGRAAGTAAGAAVGGPVGGVVGGSAGATIAGTVTG